MQFGVGFGAVHPLRREVCLGVHVLGVHPEHGQRAVGPPHVHEVARAEQPEPEEDAGAQVGVNVAGDDRGADLARPRASRVPAGHRGAGGDLKRALRGPAQLDQPGTHPDGGNRQRDRPGYRAARTRQRRRREDPARRGRRLGQRPRLKSGPAGQAAQADPAADHDGHAGQQHSPGQRAADQPKAAPVAAAARGLPPVRGARGDARTRPGARSTRPGARSTRPGARSTRPGARVPDPAPAVPDPAPGTRTGGRGAGYRQDVPGILSLPGPCRLPGPSGRPGVPSGRGPGG